MLKHLTHAPLLFCCVLASCEADDASFADFGDEDISDAVEDVAASSESAGEAEFELGLEQGGEDQTFWCASYVWQIENRGQWDMTYPASPGSGDNVTVRNTWSSYYHDAWVWNGDTLRPYWNNNVCLNAYQPGWYSNVNLYHDCNWGDPEQQWQFEPIGGQWVGSDTEFIVRLIGTNWCLNANQQWNGGNLSLWGCNTNDPDQRFTRNCILGLGWGP